VEIPLVLAGEAEPADVAEYEALAEMARSFRRYRAAVQLYGDLLLKMPPSLSGGNVNRYNAACAAVLGGSEKGADDPAPDAAEQARLRRQGLDWLRADLKAQVAFFSTADPKQTAAARQALQSWLGDPDLAAVRDKSGLDALPAAEREAWQALWADVAAALVDRKR
jgi:hypothetical protein